MIMYTSIKANIPQPLSTSFSTWDHHPARPPIEFHRLVKKKKKSWFLYPAFPPPSGSLKAAYNRLPILSPQQTPCEVGGAERALTGLLCENSSQSAVTGPRSPIWLHAEEWGIELGSSGSNSPAL